MKSKSRVSNIFLRVVPALLTLGYVGVAQAQDPAPIMTLGGSGCDPTPAQRIYRIEIGTSPTGVTDPTNPYISASPNPGGTWTFAPAPPAITCDASNVCAGLSVTLPGGTANVTPYFTGTATSDSQQLNIQVERNGMSCKADFTFEGYSHSEGWGDPHLTTVDGVHYDFQSAGEFTALREEGFEVQTRQSPVPTASVPITNAYTGITHCVAIFTAVATKIGSSRVTVQPSPGAEPDPKSMQVRVDGKVIKLGDKPYDVYAGGSRKGTLDGTIIKHPDGMYEIRDSRGTQVVVTSAYWNARKVWYLNVNVYRTSAHQGTMGKLGARSWLPALPDGNSLGAKPESMTDRYQVLYEKFADAWRVTDETSLFDYKDYGPNTSTATYTLDEWPRNNPESCAIEGETSAQGATEDVAIEACANIFNAVQRTDCEFDVMVTGNAGFGKSYEIMQRFSPLPPGWYSPVPSPKCPECEKCVDCPPVPKPPWWCHWTVIAIGIALIALLTVLVFRGRKQP